MSFCLPCKGDNSLETPGGAEVTKSGICVRCFTFWLLIVLLALGLMAHYHDAEGNVHF